MKKAIHINLDAPDTKSSATLCIYANELDAKSITSMLGCKPTHTHRKGEKPKPTSAPSPKGVWLLEAPEEMPLVEKVKWLLNATTPDKAVWDKLAVDHELWLSSAVFLHSWTDGFVFPTQVVEEIGKRHWDFHISAYSAGGDDILKAFLKKPKMKPGSPSCQST